MTTSWRTPWRLAATGMCLLIAACGTSQPQARNAVHELTETPGNRQPASAAAVRQAVSGMRNFGYDLMRESPQLRGNAVISPLSLATALAMVREGAGGRTAAQIDRVFGFPRRGLASAYERLNRDVSAKAVETANGMFVQRGLPVGQRFLRTLATYYGAPAKSVDFTAGADQVINGWVKQHTHGRIDKLVDVIDRETQLILANAVYLRARWLHPFDRDLTAAEPFTLGVGSSTQVKMMSLTERLRYASGAGWSAVELPYRGTDLAMQVLVPKPGGDPMRLLDPQVLTSLAEQWSVQTVGVKLPRWDFETSLPSLNGPLASLGMPAAFNSATADFSAISPGLFLAEVVHKANITVGERGTVAAAVTGAFFEASGTAPPPVTVSADHPFAFVLLDRTTGTPVFEGVVADPSAS